MEQKYLGFKEAAAVYSVSKSLLRREADLGRLRTRRVHARVLIKLADLDEWFERTAKPESDDNSKQAVR
jgi:excisionase family DNA binding protein